MRILARWFAIREFAHSGRDADRTYAPRQNIRDDALSEYLRGCGHAEVAPEILMRIL